MRTRVRNFRFGAIASVLALSASLTLAFGCSDPPPPPERGIPTTHPGARAESTVPAATPHKVANMAPTHLAPTTPPPATQEAAPQATPDEAPGRDLPSELRELVGNPTDCLPTGPDTPNEVNLNVTASVSVTGIVTRVSVGGVSLSREQRICFERRLETLRMRAPVPGAPRSVSTRIELRRPAPPNAE